MDSFAPIAFKRLSPLSSKTHIRTMYIVSLLSGPPSPSSLILSWKQGDSASIPPFVVLFALSARESVTWLLCPLYGLKQSPLECEIKRSAL